jgi:rod shape determining protein RodA
MLDFLKIDKKLLKQLDYSIILLAISIVVFGSINIYNSKANGPHYMKLQLLWLLVGIFVLYVIILMDYAVISNYVPVIYWASIALLIYNDIFSTATKGASGWIKLGSRAIQPSEFAKLALILMLAKKLNSMDNNINNVKNFFILMFYTIIPMGLIVIQPDMGMTMVCFFIVLGIFFISGLNLKVILGGLTSIGISIALVWNSGIMPEYWKKRLTIFLDPEVDELNYGLQLVTSKTGIGSGGIFGSGAKFGPNASGGYVSQFVPEAHNDFIFSVVGEKWGLIGGIFLLTLYGIFIYRTIVAARRSKDIFGTVICVGIASYFIFAVMQNIGMTIGIMPTTGITLPLMSYGGSSILTNFMAIGLVLNVGMRRKKINF